METNGYILRNNGVPWCFDCAHSFWGFFDGHCDGCLKEQKHHGLYPCRNDCMWLAHHYGIVNIRPLNWEPNPLSRGTQDALEFSESEWEEVDD